MVDICTLNLLFSECNNRVQYETCRVQYETYRVRSKYRPKCDKLIITWFFEQYEIYFSRFFSYCTRAALVQ